MLNPDITIDDDKVPHSEHNYYINDGLFTQLFDKDCIEQVLITSIDTIFIALDYSDIAQWQDPVSFDKMIELMVSYKNKLLGSMINTRQLTMRAPDEFITEVVNSLHNTWGDHWCSFVAVEEKNLEGNWTVVDLLLAGSSSSWFMAMFP